MNQLNLFPKEVASSIKLLLVNFGEVESKYCLKLLAKIRQKDISAELYPEAAKLKKQMSYANSKGIAYVALIGENEMKNGKITLKEMDSGNQSELNFNELVNKLINN